jgi:hypothetical protein
MLIENPGFPTFTDTRCGKMRSRMCSESPARIVQARKTLEMLSDRHGAVDIFELFMSPILNPTVYS